jgi:type IV pilus assembly protein PilB
MTLNDELRERILSEASTADIMRVCISSGMQTLRESGINRILDGITSIEEVLGETIAAEA